MVREIYQLLRIVTNNQLVCISPFLGYHELSVIQSQRVVLDHRPMIIQVKFRACSKFHQRHATTIHQHRFQVSASCHKRHSTSIMNGMLARNQMSAKIRMRRIFHQILFRIWLLILGDLQITFAKYWNNSLQKFLSLRFPCCFSMYKSFFCLSNNKQ